MFGITSYVGFLVASILLNMTPGIDTIYVISKSVTLGKKEGIVSALGISTSILFHTVLLSLGLSAILAKSVIAFNIIKFIGSGYLIVMGIKSIISKESIIIDEQNMENHKEKTLFKSYKQGIITNFFNPKMILFFLAFLPGFVSSTNTYGSLPFIILGLSFALTSTLWSVLLACISSFFFKLLLKNKTASKLSNKIAGGIYILLGLKVLKVTS